MFKGFKEFIVRGNVVDLAVGVVMGAAFGTLVNSLVKGFLTPLVGIIAKVPDFSGWQFSINGSKFLLGELINSTVAFLLVAIAVYFFVVLPTNSLMRKLGKLPEGKLKKCPECLSEVPKDAKRCSHCTQSIM